VGYRYGNRIATLRRLVQFFESNGITTQAALETWARTLAYAAFKWLIMRLGVDTIKPDVHVLAFVETAIGKRLSDIEAVAILERVARDLEIPAAQLDARIWTYQRVLRSAGKALGTKRSEPS